jgi:hypothetical protein
MKLCIDGGKESMGWFKMSFKLEMVSLAVHMDEGFGF